MNRNETTKAVQLLRDEFAQRQRKNPSYSLRAFALHIGLNAGTVSSLFSGGRKLTPKTARRILERIPMSPVKREIFQTYVRNEYTDSLSPTLFVDGPRILSEENHFRIISEWEHYAILTLMDLKTFRPSPAWIARRLGLPQLRIEQALSRLINEGLLQVGPKGKLTKSNERYGTTEDVASAALRQAHEEELKIAQSKLNSLPVNDRDFSSLIVASSKRRLALAKERIRLFRKEMIALLEDPSADEVYQVQIQLFPLTRSDTGASK